MSPELSTTMAVVAIIEKMGGWSVGGVLVFITITPAVFVYFAARITVKAINNLSKQIDELKRDYEDNIAFVESQRRLVDRIEDTMRRLTIVMTKLVDRIDTIREVK